MTAMQMLDAILERMTPEPIKDLPFIDVIDALPTAIYTTDADGRIDHYNKAAVEIWGREPDRCNKFWCGSWRLFSPDGLPLPHADCPMARALKSGQAIRGEEAVAERPDGVRVPFLAYPTPLRDASGAVIGALNMLVDISHRKSAETELNRRIAQLHAVSELGMFALTTDDQRALFDQAVDHLAKGLDVEFTKVLELCGGGQELLLCSGIGWRQGLVGQACVHTGPDSQAGYTLSVAEPVLVADLRSETRFTGPNILIEHGVVSGLSVIIPGEAGRPFGVLGAHTATRREFNSHDVHFLQSVASILASAISRGAYRDRQAIMLRELAHRMKNNMAIVHSVAKQSGRCANNVGEYIEDFEGRLRALERAHQLLTEDNWAGASIGNILKLEIDSQAGLDNIHHDIEEIMLGSSDAQAISLVFHELMTNAIKYGALSNGKGRVTIEGGRVQDGMNPCYRLLWTESGGPAVRKPDREGFGSKLLTLTVERQWGGRLSFDWHPKGLHIECVLPLSSIAISK